MINPPIIQRDLCAGCYACVEMCPNKVLAIDNDNICFVANPNKCTNCGKCLTACAMGALSLKNSKRAK